MRQFLIRFYKDLALLGNLNFYRFLPVLCDTRGAQSDLDCLHSAIDWLLLSNRMCDGNGFASTYSFYKGWGPPYLETTGYIIPTLYSFMQLHDYRREELLQSVWLSGRFLLNRQFHDGSYSNSASPNPFVFDTGQTIFGLLALYEQEQDVEYLEAAIRAGSWICEHQDSSGSWVKHTYRNIPRTYYARVSWALAELAEKTGREKFRDSAYRQLKWTIGQQKSNGWFKSSSFSSNEKPVLHTIAYTIEGLWKSAQLLGEKLFYESAILVAQALADLHKRDKVLFGFYDSNWDRADHSRCLTGLCQIALIWQEMAGAGIEYGFDQVANETLGYVKKYQLTGTVNTPWKGALMGSVPPWGRYMPWNIPNWGVKYFIDALLMKQGLQLE